MNYIGLQAALRNDPKIEKLLNAHGAQGLGLYIWLVLAVTDKTTSKNLWCELEFDSELTAHKMKMDEPTLQTIMADMVKWHLLELYEGAFYCPRVLKYASKALRNDVSNVDEISDSLVKAYQSRESKTIEIIIKNSKGQESRCQRVPPTATKCQEVSEGGSKVVKVKEGKDSLIKEKLRDVPPTATSTPNGGLNKIPTADEIFFEAETKKLNAEYDDFLKTLEKVNLPDDHRAIIKDRLSELDAIFEKRGGF